MYSHLEKQFLCMTWKWRYHPSNGTALTLPWPRYLLCCGFITAHLALFALSKKKWQDFISCLLHDIALLCDVSPQHLHEYQCHEMSTKAWRVKSDTISQSLQKISLGTFNKKISKVTVQCPVALESSRFQTYQPSWEMWVCVTINTCLYTELYSSPIWKQNSTKTKNVRFTQFSF